MSGKRWQTWLSIGWLTGYGFLLLSLYQICHHRLPYQIMSETVTDKFSSQAAALFILLIIWYGLLVGFYRYFNLSRKAVIWAIVLISGIAFASLPAASIDTAGYLVGARNAVLNNLNPLLTPLSGAPNSWAWTISPVYWYHQTLPYGPAFLPIIYLAARVSPADIWLALFVYKFVVWLVYGWLIWLFDRSLKKDGHSTRLWLLALNPALLVHGLQDGHNDLLSATLIMAGLLALINQNPRRTYWWWSLSMAVKLQSVILWPLGWHRNGRWQWHTILTSLVIGLGVMTLFMNWYHLSTSQWMSNLSYFNKGCLYFCSPFVTLIQQIGWSTLIVGLVSYNCFAWWFIVRHHDLPRAGFWLMFTVIFIATTWFAPWYMLLLVPLALLINKPAYDLLTWLLTAISISPFILMALI